MAKSSVKVDIWNRALFEIGETSVIESEEADDNNSEAFKVASRVHDDCVDYVLEDGRYCWAHRECGLTEVGEQTQAYAYADQTSYTVFEFTMPWTEVTQVEVVKESAAGVDTELDNDDDYTLNQADPDAGTLANVTLEVALAAGETLHITVTTTRVGFDHLYSLPSDFVAPVAVLYGGLPHSMLPEDSKVDFELVDDRAGGFWLACNLDVDTDDIDALEYISNGVPLAAWPRVAIDALVYRLASKFARALPKNAALAREMEQLYDLAKAKAVAAAETNRQAALPQTPSLVARG